MIDKRATIQLLENEAALDWFKINSDADLKKLTPQHMALWIKYLARPKKSEGLGITSATIGNCKSILSSIFTDKISGFLYCTVWAGGAHKRKHTRKGS